MSKPNNTKESSVVPPGQLGYTHPTTVIALTVPLQTAPVQTAPVQTAPVQTTELGLGYDGKLTLGWAIAQILCAFVCFVDNAAGMVVEQNSNQSFFGCTMCSAFFLFVADAFGIAYYEKPRTRLGFVGLTVMSLISGCLCYGMFIWTPVVPSSAECIREFNVTTCYLEYNRMFVMALVSLMGLLQTIIFTYIYWDVSFLEATGARTTTEATVINNTAQETGGASPLQAEVELRSAQACVEMSKPNNTNESSVVPPGQPGYTQPTTVRAQTAPVLTAELHPRYKWKQLLLGIALILGGCLITSIYVNEIVIKENSIRWIYIYYIGRGFVGILMGPVAIAINMKTRTRLGVVGLIVMSIISGCLCFGIFVWPHLFLSSAHCSFVSYRNCYREFGRNILTLLVSLAGTTLAGLIGFENYADQSETTGARTTTESTRINNTAQETGGASLLQAALSPSMSRTLQWKLRRQQATQMYLETLPLIGSKHE